MAYTPKPEQLQKFYNVVSQLQGGAPSLKPLLKRERLGNETFNRINNYLATNTKGEVDATRLLVKKLPQYKAGEQGPARQVGMTYLVEPRYFHLLTVTGEVYYRVPLDAKNASLVGNYWNEVDNALNGRPAGLAQYQSIAIRDIHGNIYRLLTDINAILAWLDSMTDAEQNEFWATLYLKGSTAYAA